VIAVRTLRKLVDGSDRPPISTNKSEIMSPGPKIGAERAEEKEFEEAKKRDTIAERYRTKIDKY
jgi:hypothetical protein